ncbi:Hsp70 family protein [Yinghuangia aomiensis]
MRRGRRGDPDGAAGAHRVHLVRAVQQRSRTRRARAGRRLSAARRWIARRASCRSTPPPRPAASAARRWRTALPRRRLPPGLPRSSRPPNCGRATAAARPMRREAKACSVCGATAADAGLRCPSCARVNPTGVDDCVGCGAAMPISNPQDITPKDLGVELDDGRMSVVIPKGTTYPTSSPVSRDFRTAGGGSTRLEVSVYEGTHDIAELNELCGHVNVQLPPDLPNGTPLTDVVPACPATGRSPCRCT